MSAGDTVFGYALAYAQMIENEDELFADWRAMWAKHGVDAGTGKYNCKKMSNNELADFLANYNDWRRDNGDMMEKPVHQMPNPKHLGEVIDEVVLRLKARAQQEYDIPPLKAFWYLLRYAAEAPTPIKSEYVGKWRTFLVGIGKDHSAEINMPEETFNALKQINESVK